MDFPPPPDHLPRCRLKDGKECCGQGTCTICHPPVRPQHNTDETATPQFCTARF